MLGRIAYDGCPLCNGRATTLRSADCSRHPLWCDAIGREIVWLKCDDCGHVYTEGYFTEEALAAIMEKNHPPTVGLEEKRYISARIVEKVARHVLPEGLWLDVGFGSPSLLMTAQEWGFEPHGLDLRQSCVDEAISLGIQAKRCDMFSLAPSKRYDVISLCDVLEHMPFPKQQLMLARRLLGRDGVLFVSMPAYDSPIWRAFDSLGDNPYWREIEHFHNFSRERLFELLRECDLNPIHYDVSQRYRLCMEIIAQ